MLLARIKLLDREKGRPPPMLERICQNFMLVFASITVICIMVCVCCTCIVYIDDFVIINNGIVTIDPETDEKKEMLRTVLEDILK